MGGIVAAIEAGFPQKEIADAAYHYQRQLDRGVKTVVGVNKHVMKETDRPELLRIGPEVEREQLEGLAAVRDRRDDRRLADDLQALRRAAESGANLIPPMLQCVRDYGTVGEISAALVPVFGTYREVSVL
jgi:methylmalonyl-CoA mutase N-terminal domain/subunit